MSDIVEAELSAADGGFRLHWRGGPVEVHLPAAADFALDGAHVVTGEGESGELALGALPPGRPWAFVRPVGAAGRWVAERVVRLGGANNFRDLGGYRGRDGRRVRWGRVYRSNRLVHLTDEDLDQVDALGIAAVCDLRSAEERAADPSRWRSLPASVFESAKPNVDDVRETLMGGDPDAREVGSRMVTFYATLPTRYAEEYRALFSQLAACGAAHLFHCTAGKDRTGVAAALLLDLLGVARGDIIADYAMTERLLHAEWQARLGRSALGGDDRGLFFSLAPEARFAVWRTDPAYIVSALDAVEQAHGSTAGYLQSLGLTSAQLDQLRCRLLAEEGREHL